MKETLLTVVAALTAISGASFNVPAKTGASVKPGIPTSTTKMYGTLKSPSVAARPGMMKAGAGDTGVIETAPEGTLTTMLGSSQTFYIYYDEIAMDETFGLAYEGIFTEDGEVYLKNPVSMLDWDTYIKGTVTEEGLKFEFPQPIYSFEDEEGSFDLYVDVLEYTEVTSPTDPNEYYTTFVPSEETRSITFTKTEDGNYSMLDDYMLGVTWEGLWQGYGEMYLTLTPFEATAREIPSGIDYDYSYILADELNGWDHTILRQIGIGEADGVTYISGLASGMPDAVIYGTFDKDTNRLTIPSDQFLGKYYNHYIFMMAGEGYSYYDDYWEEDMIEFDITDNPLVLEYDPETNVYTPVVAEGYEYAYIIFNFGNTAAYPCEYYTVDRIYSQGKITDFTPIAPEILFVNEISYIDPDYSYAFEFNIFGDNAEGQMLRDANIYYNIFVNGALYTFTAEEYPTLAEEGVEEVTDIPVFLNAGEDIFASGTYHGIAFKRKDIETIGVRSLYIDGDVRAESEIVTVTNTGEPVGVGSVQDIHKAKTEYFDVLGRRISGRNASGITVRRTTDSQGNVKTEKAILR